MRFALAIGALVACVTSTALADDPPAAAQDPPAAAQDPPAAAQDPPAVSQDPPAAQASDADSATEVATRTPLTTREVPGVVSVVQREEIERSGAVDLVDLLHLVPGFSFGVDVEGVVGLAFRGMWGHEGKVLVLVDGLELNETLYGTTQMGLHIPASVIERVEVIRGPGSVVYGGFAELAVINVVTRDARTLPGAAGSVTYGQMGRSMGLLGASASYATSSVRAQGLSFSGHLAYLDGIRSDRTYSDFAGKTVDLSSNSHLGGLFVDVGAAYRGLKLRLVYDDYRVDTRDGVMDVVDPISRQRFESILGELRYEARLADTVTLTPRLVYKRQTPWQDRDASSGLFYDKTAQRALAGLQLSWRPLSALDVLAGVDGFLDQAEVNDARKIGLQTLFGDDMKALTFTQGNVAGYAQVFFRNFIANLTLGARYEYNTRFGSSFVPRIGLTRVLGRFHFKALYSRAFRAPSIENINLNSTLQPEFTDVVEGELGLQLSGHLALSANGFFIRTSQPIVYDVVPGTNDEVYLNAERTGTAGAEAQLRMRYAWGYLNLGYSFARVAEQNRVTLYAVPGDDTRLLGMPQHKASLSAGVNVWQDHVALGVTAVVIGPRTGYLNKAEDGSSVLGTEPTTTLLGATVFYRNLGTRGLDLSLGAQNLLDQTYRVLQPYDAGHAPLPMAGRTVMLRLAYSAPLPD